MKFFLFMIYPVEGLFIFMVFFGVIFGLSSMSWVGVWLGLEMNLFGLMPVFTLRKWVGEVESSIIYFLTQSIGSVWVLFGILMSYFNYNFYYFCIFLGVSVKFGLGPFFFWIPKVMVGLSWVNCVILSTWQKVLPLFIFFMLMEMNVLVMFMCMFSVLAGGVGGINQVSVRSLMAYSSIGHMGWFVSMSLVGWLYSLIYFLIYCMLSVLIFFIIGLAAVELMYIVDFSFSGFNMGQFFCVLSVAGIPPFIGFFGKMVGIMVMMPYFMMVCVLLLGSFFSLYYYLLFSFSVCGFSISGWYMEYFFSVDKWSVMFFLVNFVGWVMVFCLMMYALTFFY